MGVSRQIVNILAQSLRDHISDDDIVVESFGLNTADIETRPDIPVARVAIYEGQEAVAEQTGRGRPSFSLQNYTVDISVVRAYWGDKADEAEDFMVDQADNVKEWVKGVDVATLTNSAIYNLAYISATSPIRNNRYTTKTLVLQAKRDLFFDQSDLPPGPAELTDADGKTLTDSQFEALYE